MTQGSPSVRVSFRGICLILALAAARMATAAPPDLEFFKTKVQPVLREHCLKCHSHAAGKARGGLVLDSHSSLLAGGDSGPAIDSRDLDASLLLEAVRYDSDDIQMPPAGKIDDGAIAVLTEWVLRGAPAPDSAVERATDEPADTEEHWAFEPLRKVSVPSTAIPGADAIDTLVEAARRRAGVQAVRQAPRRAVIQRLFLDLKGLPPAPEVLDSLASEQGPPIAEIAESLIAQPEFGERWGRHWLDVARYADSNGCSIESNNTYDNAWRYRDYVIESLNADKPYDRFVVEQIAGDLLPYESSSQRCEQLIATGFLLLGPKAFGTGSYDQLRLDVIDEQIDTVGKAMLGMSLGCARCHDHKFDPVSTKDYYALAGIFASTESIRRAKGWRQGKSWNRVQLPILDEATEKALLAAHDQTRADAGNGKLKEQAEQQLEKARSAMRAATENGTPQQRVDAERAMELAERAMFNAQNMAKVLPVISPVPVAMAVVDRSEPVDETVRVRGEPKNEGDRVVRRVPPLLDAEHPQLYRVPEDASGRLQLAEWLVDPEHGAGQLLARVAVNRVWGHLFARPLVASVDNFGLTGERPTHPELLDYLADRFIASGWSVKSLVRDIVLTDTYQLSAAEHAENTQVDPANQWLWRYQPKRIDVEVLRDSMLAISGQLDPYRGGKTLQHLGLVSLRGDHLVLDAPSPYRRRSVYLPIYRDAIGLTPEVDASMGMLGTFDFADPNLMAGARSQTVVPAQALFMMNSEFVYEQSRRLAESLLGDESLDDDAARVDHLFRIVFGRSADHGEVAAALDFVRNFSSEDGRDEQTAAQFAAWTGLCQAVFGSNEFLFQD